MTRRRLAPLTVAAALAAVAPAWGHVTFVAGEPDGDGWIPMTELSSDDNLDRLVATLLGGEARGRLDVAGSYLAGWLTQVVAGPATASYRASGSVWSLEHLAVRPHEAGWFDGLAVTGGELLAHDAASFAGALVDVLEPFYAALRPRVRFGFAGMWGTLADTVADDALFDALSARVPRLRARPRVQVVPWSGGEHRYRLRSTCCLWYKVYEGDADPAGEGYCTSCPLRTDESRAAEVASWLESGRPA